MHTVMSYLKARFGLMYHQGSGGRALQKKDHFTMMAGKEVKCFIKISTEFLCSTKSSHYSGTENYQMASTV